ncbi:L-aspartate oxidase [Malonomonas rubra DSM 5091]|uniref:L-aspartate oxidase n=1 Tax=Malonomonas rubra DSM 5091 TaxID=1122189 RepID=A0A1M6K9U3_MALRU|nr:L-aspartate oxidase [Malonomonas rubra]SHJ55716.1 L-aspartate oxidase [Malonomonas rubra DSM 5091]
MKITSDFLVIGTGIAGLSYALKVADKGTVSLITKRDIDITATQLAQGGIAAVSSKEDSFQAHAKDTMVAGVDLPHADVVDLVVEAGPKAVADLIQWGVNFSRNRDNEYDLTREGGHSHRRILHAKDATGREIERALVEAAQAHPNITLYQHHIAVDLITEAKIQKQELDENRCLGAYILDIKNDEVITFGARFTVLATGGAGKVYLYTCNPDIATGDGLAIGWRAGASVANMEFMQFHPTTLYHPNAKSFLISEAVRGEGAILKRSDGYAFMPDYHDLKDLAPRDIVARAIDNEMKKHGDDCVFLDITHKGEDYIKDRFPTIYQTCLEYGIDMTKEPIPVVPAAHYLCGGLKTDTNGETSIRNLFAIGEVACTGLHGANRLASNSLLEGIVFAKFAAEESIKRLTEEPPSFPSIEPWDCGSATCSDEEVVVAHNWDEIRRSMWNYVGIVRSNKRLHRAMSRINLIQEEIIEYYWNFYITSDLIELRNITTVAKLIVQSALMRKESRGLHYTIDYPEADANSLHDTIIPGCQYANPSETEK